MKRTSLPATASLFLSRIAVAISSLFRVAAVFLVSPWATVAIFFPRAAIALPPLRAVIASVSEAIHPREMRRFSPQGSVITPPPFGLSLLSPLRAAIALPPLRAVIAPSAKQSSNTKSPLAQGFTLLELMLVIVIITVMMVATVKTMQERVAALRVQRAAQDIQSILSAAQDYFVAHGVWPGSGMSFTSTEANGGAASHDAVADLVGEGYLVKVTNSPWGTPYQICPNIVEAGAASSVITCPAATLPLPASAENVSFFVYFSLPNGLSSVASEVAGVIPNGVNSCTQAGQTGSACQVQAQVIGPSGVLNMANYIQYATVVPALCYDDTSYQPLSAANAEKLKQALSAQNAGAASVAWPPPSATKGGSPQVPAPGPKDCPATWIPQIYAVPAGFSSVPMMQTSSKGLAPVNDPSTGGQVYSPLAGFFVSPVTRYTQSGGKQVITGWDIYATAIQGAGNTGSAGGLISVCGGNAMVMALVKCTPPSMTSTVVP